MGRIANFIVRHKKKIIIFFLLILIPSFIGGYLTKTNYDMLSYLPDDLNSKQGQDILIEDFGISGSVYLLVQDRKLWNVAKLKEEIANIDGVYKVSWIDDYSDITIPIDFIPGRLTDQFISGKSTILQIEFTEGPESDKTVKAIEKIHGLGGDNTFLAGQPAITYDLKSIMAGERNLYLILALVAILIILSLATTSYIEPILFIFSMGVAILLNMGTNIFFGEISYITVSLAAAIQLGVSMDYSIFLLHRYQEEKKLHPSKTEAMASAITKTTTTISASAMTTVAGFMALTVMAFGIGKDLGFVLAKGVILSLITILTFLPCLVLTFDKAIEKTRHRVLLPNFKHASRWIVRGRWILLVLVILLIVPSFLAQRNLSYYYSPENTLPESAKSMKDAEVIQEEFGAGEIIYLITADEGLVKEKQLTGKVKAVPQVESVSSVSELVGTSMPSTFIPESLKDRFSGAGYSFCSIELNTASEDEGTKEALYQIREIASGTYDQWYLTGGAVLINDLSEFTGPDLRNVMLLSIGLIALIIAISFKSIAIPIILVLLIQLAIWINLGIPYFSGSPISFITAILIGAIQLGATVDYAILFTTRYRENLISCKKLEAMQKTIRDTGRPILTSALVLLAVTLTISLITSIKTTGELTGMIGRGAIISMIVIFLGLPTLLLVFDKVIGWTTWRWKGNKKIS